MTRNSKCIMIMVVMFIVAAAVAPLLFNIFSILNGTVQSTVGVAAAKVAQGLGQCYSIAHITGIAEIFVTNLVFFLAMRNKVERTTAVRTIQLILSILFWIAGAILVYSLGVVWMASEEIKATIQRGSEFNALYLPILLFAVFGILEFSIEYFVCVG